MSPTFRKVALIAAVLGFAVSVFVAACGNDDEAASPPATMETTTASATTTAPPPTTTERETETETAQPEDEVRTFRITIRGGRPVGGIARPGVDKGDKVVIVVRSDVVDHVHLHGYDLMADAGPGVAARLAFDADLPGRFEIELEERGVQIGELTVQP